MLPNVAYSGVSKSGRKPHPDAVWGTAQGQREEALTIVHRNLPTLSHSMIVERCGKIKSLVGSANVAPL
jgi:hypothetical protein